MLLVIIALFLIIMGYVIHCACWCYCITLIQMEPNRMYPASFDPCFKSESHYDLCQECLGDVLKNLIEFVKQGKFNGELK